MSTSIYRATLLALLIVVAVFDGVASAAPPVGATAPGGEESALGLSLPELDDAPDRSLVGKPIRRIEVVITGTRWAAVPVIKSVRPGEPLSAEAGRRAARELLDTGQFARAAAEASAEGDGALLRIRALPRRLIATILVTGGALDRAATLEAAEVSDGGELTSTHVDELGAKVRAFYAQHGFPTAQITADTTDTDAPDRIILSIMINPGAPRTIAARVFVIDPREDGEVGDLKEKYRLAVGARVDEPALVEADRDLTDALRQHGFLRAEVKHALRHAGPLSTLFVAVQAGPRITPVFEGNRSFDADELERALGIAKSPDARPAELVERIRAFYVARGFLDAEVTATERGTTRDAVHHLAFAVRERPQVHVAHRVFPCLPKEISPDEIGSEIGSFLEEELPGGETFSAGDPRVVTSLFGPTHGAGGRGLPTNLNPLVTYAPETYERALKHLRDLFHSRGYLNAVIGPIAVLRATCSRHSPPGECIPEPPRARVAASCPKDSLGLPLPEPAVPEGVLCRPDPAHDVACSPEITLRLPIHLGPQTTLYDVAFDGNHARTEQELAKVANLTLGSALSSLDVEAARLRVLDGYRLVGFAYADVRTAVEPSPDRTRARVRFYVTEHDPVIVAGFVVKGTSRTDNALILRRVLLRRDGPYRQDLVRQTEERIAALGTFSSVSVALEDADVPQRMKRVVITVAEQIPQYIDPHVGFSSGEGIRFSFEYGHRNISGLAIALTLRVQLSYLFDFLIPADVQKKYASLDAQDRLERRNTIGVTFPEIGLGPFVAFSLEGIDVRDNQRDFGITKDALVPTLSYRPFRQLVTQLSFSGERNDVKIFNDQALASSFVGLLRVPQGKTVALAQRLNFALDFRDNPFNATKGVLFSTSVEHVNAFPTPGDNIAKDTSHFLKFSGKIAGYIRLGKKGPVVAMSLGAGYNLQLFNGSTTYPDRLFFLGGVDTMRSFLADAVVPQDLADKIVYQRYGTGRPFTVNDIAIRGGNVMVNPRVELRIPITDVVQTGIFVDAGNLWTTPSAVNPTILRYGLGAGLRFITPIGPLALDYGFNLNPRFFLGEDYTGAFHFSIGLF